MAIKVQVKSKIAKKTDKAVDMYRQKSSIYLNNVANQFKNITSKAMRASTGGRVYVVTKSGKTHTASIKGNPPAKNTGNLIRSLYVERATPQKLVAQLITEQKYAKFLEDKTGLDRPFMSKRSAPYKDTVKFAEKKFKDISIGDLKIT
tara:strand:+ start:1544 stop:1987 length:444 start_codon:yes stop_codon:yes gene_type:complete